MTQKDTKPSSSSLSSSSSKKNNSHGRNPRDFWSLTGMEVMLTSQSFRTCVQQAKDQWEMESQKYEETIPSPQPPRKQNDTKQQVVLVPRRNYPNPTGTIDDPSLFPYHTSLYPLLDAYDWVCQEEEEKEEGVVAVVRPSRAKLEGRVLLRGQEGILPGVLSTSLEAIGTSLLHPPEQEFVQHLDDDLSGWSVCAVLLRHFRHDNFLLPQQQSPPQEQPHTSSTPEEETKQQQQQQPHLLLFGPGVLAKDTTTTERERNDLLLRLFCHALSELQRDVRLALFLVYRMTQWRLFENAGFFQRFLATLMATRINCDGNCHERYLDDAFGNHNHNHNVAMDVDPPDHYCRDWADLELMLTHVIKSGIDYFTREHALLLAATFKMIFDEANPSSGKIEENLVLGSRRGDDRTTTRQCFKTSRKAHLQQAIYMWNQSEAADTDSSDDDDNDDDDDDDEESYLTLDPLSYNLLNALIRGLNERLRRERRAVAAMQMDLEQQQSNPTVLAARLDAVDRKIRSFHQGLGTLLYVGEMSIRRLPENKKSLVMCANLASGLLEAFLPPDLKLRPVSSQRLDSAASSCYKGASYDLPTLIDFDRYADSVKNATQRHRYQRELSRSRCSSSDDDDNKRRTLSTASDAMRETQWFLHRTPPPDVLDVIRGLFARDLIDMNASGFGYGDFLAWTTAQPISGRDPFLFFHSCNYPFSEDVAWVQDEIGDGVGGYQLTARYDYTLVRLMQAWHAPWTPDSHQSYQTEFRAAARCLLLSFNRCGLPLDVLHHTMQFLPRDWWPDASATSCWCDDCVVDNAVVHMQRKLCNRNNVSFNFTAVGPGKHGDTAAAVLATKPLVCPMCRVIRYKSQEHQKKDYPSHRKDCGKPPYRIPGKEEERLTNLVNAVLEGKGTGDELEVYDVVDVENEGEGYIQAEDDDDDDGSWESFDSNDEVEEPYPQSVTSVIHKYFRDNVYKKTATSGESGFTDLYRADRD